MATTVLPGYATLAIKIPWYGSPYDWQFSQYSSIPQLQLMIGKTDAATYTFIAKIKKKKIQAHSLLFYLAKTDTSASDISHRTWSTTAGLCFFSN